MGFFSYFRDYIPNFAELAKPLSDLTSKRIPRNIPWGSEQESLRAAETETLSGN